MKKQLIIVGLLSVITTVHADWSVTDGGGGSWTAVTSPLDQSAALAIPATVTDPILMTWEVEDADPGLDKKAEFAATINDGAWVWQDHLNAQNYTFSAGDNTWGNDSGTTVWGFTITTKTWAQTTGGSAVWGFDETTGRWQDDPSGTPVVWTYDVVAGEWTHVSSSSTWAYNHKTMTWGEQTSTGTTGLNMPVEPLRQQQYVRTVTHHFMAKGALTTGPTAGIAFTSNGDGTWNGTVTAGDQNLGYDSTTTGLTLTLANAGTHQRQQGTVSWQHNPTTGAWAWQRTIEPKWTEKWNFNATTWTDGQTGQAWSYSTVSKTWSSGGVSWQHNLATNRWENDPGDYVWEYSATTGRWTYDPDGVPWVFSYNMLTDTWTQVTSNEGGFPTMPPGAVVQKAIIDGAYEAIRIVGGFAASGPFDWQTPSVDSSTWTAVNASGTETLVYNPTDVGSEISWQTDDATQTFVYNVGTTGWWWQNDADPDDTFLWTYNHSTNRWALSGSSDYWTFSLSARTWTNKTSTVVWTYQPATGAWKNSATAVEWLFSPVNNSWTNQTDESVWRYDLTGRSWQVIANAPDPLHPTYKLPAEPLVQQALVSYAIDHLHVSGAFSTTGSFGWALAAQGDGSWVGDTAATDEQLIYDPTREPYMIRNRNTGAQLAQQDTFVWEYDINGDWRVTNSVDPAAMQTTSFIASTGVWTAANATTPWQWQTTPTTRWYETATERTWTFDELNKQWTDSVSSQAWSYAGSTGIWTNHAATTTWKYDAMKAMWTQLSGTTTTPVNMPPLPVIQRTLFSHIFEVVALKGVFVTVAPLAITMTAGSEEWQWTWSRSGGNASIAYDGALTGTNRFVWNTVDNSRTWKLDPATGDWSWVAIDQDAATHTWSYAATTQTWAKSDESATWKLEDGLIWRNQDDATQVWQYNPVSKQWKNLTTGSLWGYYASVATAPADDVYVWTNITASTGWTFDEQEQRWVQSAGYPDITADLPPEVVRQMTLIHVAWQGALANKVLAFVSPHNAATPVRQINGTWSSAGDTAQIVYDATGLDFQVTAQAADGVTRDWAEPLKKWQYGMNGDWQVQNHTDPFVPSDWQYDVTTKKWGRVLYDGGVTWSFDSAAVSWTNDATSDVWRYASGFWTDVTNAQTWTYSTATNVWTHVSSGREWSYLTPSEQWAEIGGGGSALTMPPVVVVQYEKVWRMQQVFAAANVFNEYPQVTWQADEYDWHAVGTKNNAQARYDARKSYQVSWRDTHTQNTVQYSMTTNDWTWRADNQHWRYNAAAGLWGRDTRALSGCWVYTTTGTNTWTNQNDATQVWTQAGTAYTWVDSVSSDTWVYDPAAATWTRSGVAATWTYNFATGAWVEITNTRVVPILFPPLPLVQQLFINALKGSIDTFFDNPLYSVAQTKPSANHPLYGTRPLEKNKVYGRYNTSSVLLNDELVLDHVTWVHDDVSRNHGRLQLPSVTTTALPAIVGGERAARTQSRWAPMITLYDSCIACHESLVSAGVRWRVTDRPLSGENSSVIDADNSSSIMGYNRGRILDMPMRRGTVFQLGSAANRMADGSIASSIQTLSDGSASESSLRDAFINVYRARATLGGTSDAPSVIDLILKTTQEDGVAQKERAYQMLQMAHESRTSIGWPSLQGDSGYAPWTLTATALATLQSNNAATLFSAGATGGGSVSIGGNNWYIGARNSNNLPPVYPITSLDQDGVVYVDHGGLLRAIDAYDVVLDTIVAHRLGAKAADAGRVEIANDQYSQGLYGKVQPYDVDFLGLAQTSGADAGHVLFHASTPETAVGRPLHGATMEKVK